MLNQNENSDYSQNKEQANQIPHSRHPSNRAEPTRRIGTATMGVTLVVCGVLLICFFFKPFDLLSLMKFSPILLILLGIELYGSIFATKEKISATILWGPFQSDCHFDCRMLFCILSFIYDLWTCKLEGGRAGLRRD